MVDSQSYRDQFTTALNARDYAAILDLFKVGHSYLSDEKQVIRDGRDGIAFLETLEMAGKEFALMQGEEALNAIRSSYSDCKEGYEIAVRLADRGYSLERSARKGIEYCRKWYDIRQDITFLVDDIRRTIGDI